MRHCKLLLAEYQTLPTTADNPGAKAILDEMLRRWSNGQRPRSKWPTWDELHATEVALLEACRLSAWRVAAA